MSQTDHQVSHQCHDFLKITVNVLATGLACRMPKSNHAFASFLTSDMKTCCGLNCNRSEEVNKR